MFEIHYHPPYDWQWMYGFLALRAVQSVEVVTPACYQRSINIDGYQGLIRLEPDERRQCVCVTFSESLLPVKAQIKQKIIRLLDLELQPKPMLEALGDLAQARQGLRLPGCMDGFEQMVRAILGQLVSVKMAAQLASKLAHTFGLPLEENPAWRIFPCAAQLACLEPQQLKVLGISLKRAEAIILLAREAVAGAFASSCPSNVESGIKKLITYPGIGRWTANYFALRGWQAKDIFLPDDYMIKQRFSGMTPAEINRYANRWQPWRSYALLHIWYSEGWVADIDEI